MKYLSRLSRKQKKPDRDSKPQSGLYLISKIYTSLPFFCMRQIQKASLDLYFYPGPKQLPKKPDR